MFGHQWFHSAFQLRDKLKWVNCAQLPCQNMPEQTSTPVSQHACRVSLRSTVFECAWSPIETKLLKLLKLSCRLPMSTSHFCLVGFGTLKQKVWTLMARWILGLTRFSACLLWRLGLTHAKLEESTSCTPSCYGPTWHLQSWLVGCNGETKDGKRLQSHLLKKIG